MLGGREGEAETERRCREVKQGESMVLTSGDFDSFDQGNIHIRGTSIAKQKKKKKSTNERERKFGK